MKITILAGSPKGDLSVTMQYVNYIIKKFPRHEYTTFHVAQQIKKIENDQAAFSEIIDSVQGIGRRPLVVPPLLPARPRRA